MLAPEDDESELSNDDSASDDDSECPYCPYVIADEACEGCLQRRCVV